EARLGDAGDGRLRLGADRLRDADEGEPLRAGRDAAGHGRETSLRAAAGDPAGAPRHRAGLGGRHRPLPRGRADASLPAAPRVQLRARGARAPQDWTSLTSCILAPPNEGGLDSLAAPTIHGSRAGAGAQTGSDGGELQVAVMSPNFFGMTPLPAKGT